jgi:hypothetical protein
MPMAEGNEMELGFKNYREEGNTVKYCPRIAIFYVSPSGKHCPAKIPKSFQI